MKSHYDFYLASGFFNERQLQTLALMEAYCNNLNYTFYSPRTESIDFRGSVFIPSIEFHGKSFGGFPLNLTEKDNKDYQYAAIDLIYKNNIRRLEASERIFVNLDGHDLGTLYELGYFVGRGITSNLLCLIKEDLNHDDGLFREKPLVSLISYYKDVVHFMGDHEEIESITRWTGTVEGLQDLQSIVEADIKKYFPEDILSKFPVELDSKNLPIPVHFDTTNRCVPNILFIGMLKGLRMPVVTFSTEKQDTNLMLSSAVPHFTSPEEYVQYCADREWDAEQIAIDLAVQPRDHSKTKE